MPRFRVTAPDGAAYEVNAPEGATEQDAIAYIASQLQQPPTLPEAPYERTYSDVASAAFNRGMGGIGVTLGDELPAYLASILAKSAPGTGIGTAADAYARQQLADAEQARQSLEERFPTKFRSYEDVEGIGDAATYITEQFLGSALPSIATIGATAAGTALAAPVIGVGAGTLGTVGAALGGFSLMAPESFAGIYQETGQLEPAAATIAGAINTALETALPARIFGKLAAPVKAKVIENILAKSGMQPSIARRAVTETFKSAGLEGLTEGTQEAVNIAAERVIAENPEAFGSEEIQRIMESFVAGSAGGAPFGVASGAVEAVRERSAASNQARAIEAEKLRIAEAQRKADEEKATAEARFIIPTDPKLRQSWLRDTENLGVKSPPLNKALEQVAGKDIRDPAQAALVYKVLSDFATKTQSGDIAAAIDKYLQKPFFDAFRTGKPAPTKPPAATGTPPTGTPPTGTPPTGTPPTGTPPTGTPKQTGESLDELTDEEIAARLKEAGAREEAEQADVQATAPTETPPTETPPTGTAPTETPPTETTATPAAPQQPENTIATIWADKNVDQPVFVYNEPAQPPGPDGRVYSRVRAPGAQQDSFVPTDEIKNWLPPGTAPDSSTFKTAYKLEPTQWQDENAVVHENFDAPLPNGKTKITHMAVSAQAGDIYLGFVDSKGKDRTLTLRAGVPTPPYWLLGDASEETIRKNLGDELYNAGMSDTKIANSEQFAELTEKVRKALAKLSTPAKPAAPAATEKTPFKLTTAELPALGVLEPALRTARFKDFDTKSPTEQATALEGYFNLEPIKLNTAPEKQAEVMRTIEKLRGQSVSVAPKKEEPKKEEPKKEEPKKEEPKKEEPKKEEPKKEEPKKEEKTRKASIRFDGESGIVSNESVLGGLRRVSEDDDIALEYPERAGAVVLTSIERQAGGQEGRASEVLSALTKWADKNNERLVLMPAASGDLKQPDLIAWYERNGFTKKADGAMERAPVVKAKKPRKSKSTEEENIPGKRTSIQKRDALRGMGFTNGEIDVMSEATQEVYLDLERSKLPLTAEGKYILPMLADNPRIQKYYKLDEDGKRAIDALTKAHPLSKLEQKIERQEKLTPEELSAWYFHTYEPASAMLVMEAESTMEITTRKKKKKKKTEATEATEATEETEDNVRFLTEPEILGVKTTELNKKGISVGRTENKVLREAAENISEALEWLNDKFADNTELQLVRAKARAATYQKAQAYFAKYTRRRKNEAEIEIGHLLSDFRRGNQLGDFYVYLGINDTFDPSKSSDDTVARNDEVDEEIYKEPGEEEVETQGGKDVAEQDELLTASSSFEALKANVQATLAEGEKLGTVLKEMGITTAKQFKIARAAALTRRGNLSKEEADEVATTGILVDAVEKAQQTTFLTAKQKQEQQDEILADTQEFLRSGRGIEQLPPGKGGKEGGASGQERRYIRYLRKPKFRGPDFNPAIRAAVEQGEIRAVINELIKSNSKNADLVQLLRKLLPVVGKTKIVLDGGIPLFSDGMYVPEMDTVHLDSVSGMNEHTLLHEIFHAGLARIVGDPKHPLSNEFQKLFSAVKTQLGDAYGGTDMQEFGAELGGNPEFQALLKTIKAPRSENLLTRVWEMFLEAIGIRKRSTAYDKAIKLVNDILDVSGGLEPLPGEAMFLGGDPTSAIPDILSRKPGTTEELLNSASKLKPKALRVLMNFVSLNNKENMLEGTEVKQLLHDYMVAVQKKKADQDRLVDEVSKEYEDKIASVERDPKYAAAWAAMSELAIDIRLAHVEVVELLGQPDKNGKRSSRPPFKPKNEKQKAEFEKLMARFNALPEPVREAYRIIRQRLDDFAHEYVETVAAMLDSKEKKDEFRSKFYELEEVIGYIPFMRFGDFWISFTDPVTKKYTAATFDSPRERETIVAEIIKTYPELKDKITMRDSYEQMLKDVKIPPSSFIAQLEINLKDAGAPQDIIDVVKDLYIRSYPQQALLQQFKKSKGVPGMSRDIGRAYASAAGKWVYRLTSLKHNGPISAKLATFTEEVRDQHQGDSTIMALMQSVEKGNEFVLSPQVPTLSTALTQLSAFEYIAGSLSSAAVNLTGLMFMVHPMLSGRFGAQALGVMGNASLNPVSKLREQGGAYTELAKELDARDLLRTPVSKEILNRGKKSLDDYSTLGTKVKEFLAWPFVKSEEYMRAATAIAAYNLALKGGGPFNLKPATQKEAIEYAAKVIQDAHTAGMSEIAAPYLQHPVGRVILTFKSIVLAQATYLGQQFRNWWKDAGDDPEAQQLKRFARRYLLYTYGTSFALLGAKGLPFMGATTVLMRIIELLIPDDDDEPYDPREQVNGVFGDFLYRGLFATIFGIDVSERASLANDVFFRDDPQSIRENGYVRTMLFNLFGPMGTYAINAEKGIGNIFGGDLYKGVEDVMPAFVRNGMRGYRYYLDGVTTSTGSPVVEDVNAWQAAVQSIGFTPAEVGEIYEVRARAKTYETALLDIKSKILDKYFLGKSTGDFELIREAQAEAAEFRRKYPTLMNATTLERSYRSRVSAEEEKLAGLRFSKALLPEIADKYFSE